MNERDSTRMQHMLLCCDSIAAFIKGKKRSELSSNHLLDCAIRHQLQVLGEAANSISKKTQESLPKIPWKQIVGLRNKLIHEYFDIDYSIIWITIKEELPMLALELKKLLSSHKK